MRIMSVCCLSNSCWRASSSGSLILFYFCLSIGLTFYQKWFLKQFHYPFSVTTCHMFLKFFFAVVFRYAWIRCSGKQRVLLSWRDLVQRVAPMGVASGLDIAFSNASFEYITVSLYTMSKSTAIVFILGFAILFKLEKMHGLLVVVILSIAGGLFMFTYKSSAFNYLGFGLVMTASFLSGLRWTLAQLVMQKSQLGLENPIDMIFYTQPWMFFSTVIFAVGFEGASLLNDPMLFCSNVTMYPSLRIIGLVVSGAVIAFIMEVSEYLVVCTTSSLTFAIAGICKEIFTLTLAIFVQKDEVSAINAIGLVVCLCGIIVHVIYKTMYYSQHPGGAGGEHHHQNNYAHTMKVPVVLYNNNHHHQETVPLKDNMSDTEDDVLYESLYASQKQHKRRSTSSTS